MAARMVHWHEGMFLQPHHLQAADRHDVSVDHFSVTLNLHHFWGLRAIEWDRDALSNGRFVVKTLKARLTDGTLVSIPDDGVLPPVELKPALERSPNTTIYLAIPVARLGRPNVTTDPGDTSARYQIDTLEFEDENTGVNPQPLKVRRLNLKVLFSGQDRTGFETLPLARIVRSARAEATPELDETYIPPVLACDAWAGLQANILQAVYDRLGKKIEVIANQVVSRGIGFESTSSGDALLINQLRELNESFASLSVTGFVPGIHPLWAFRELCRLVGQLAIFGPTRRVPALPRYDHDDLGGCFFKLKQYIDELLDIVVEPEYRERAFIGAGLRMQVALEPAWLESAWQMFIGVQSNMDGEELIRLLTRPGQLDMKVGSSDRVDAIFRMGAAGLQFTHTPRPPRALPSVPGLVYFQVMRETAQQEWTNVQRSLTLAVRINETLVAGNIQGQRVLTIQTSGRSVPLQFTLYVVPTRALAQT